MGGHSLQHFCSSWVSTPLIMGRLLAQPARCQPAQILHANPTAKPTASTVFSPQYSSSSRSLLTLCCCCQATKASAAAKASKPASGGSKPTKPSKRAGTSSCKPAKTAAGARGCLVRCYCCCLVVCLVRLAAILLLCFCSWLFVSWGCCSCWGCC